MGRQQTAGAGSNASPPDVEPRCGTHRPSMDTNVLIAKTALGRVKRTTFNAASPQDRAFGTVAPHDAEGARAVISSWRGHQSNPHAKPGPDFKAMNKAAAGTGLVSSGQFRAFRAVHPITLTRGVEGVAKPAPPLPSDSNPEFTYGKPAKYRPAEVVRACGKEEPAMRGLMQGAFSTDWVHMNTQRQDAFDARRGYIRPRPTGATQGHALGAQRTIAAAAQASGPGAKQWKMPRFEGKASARVTRYMCRAGGGGSPDELSGSGGGAAPHLEPAEAWSEQGGGAGAEQAPSEEEQC